jgi:hypothetical protein
MRSGHRHGLKRADQGCILAVAERFGVQAGIHVERADMRHVLVGPKQPGNHAIDDGELALEAARNLADLDQHRFHCGGRPVVVLGGLGAAFAGNLQIKGGLADPRFCAHCAQ